MSGADSFGAAATADVVPRQLFIELGVKFEDLKTRAAALKKARADEKARADRLEDDIKVKDEELHKKVAQIDTLNFQVQRLTARCSKLMKELEDTTAKLKEAQSKGGLLGSLFGGGGGGGANQQEQEALKKELEVARQELMTQITAHQIVHLQLDELRNSTEEQIRTLTSKINELQLELATKDEKIAESNAARTKLTEDLNSLQSELHSVRTSSSQRLAELQADFAQREQAFNTLSEQIQQQMRIAQRRLRVHVAFDDTRFSHLNQSTLPQFSSVLSKAKKHVITTAAETTAQARTHVRNLLEGLAAKASLCLEATLLSSAAREGFDGSSGADPTADKTSNLVSVASQASIKQLSQAAATLDARLQDLQVVLQWMDLGLKQVTARQVILQQNVDTKDPAKAIAKSVSVAGAFREELETLSLAKLELASPHAGLAFLQPIVYQQFVYTLPNLELPQTFEDFCRNYISLSAEVQRLKLDPRGFKNQDIIRHAADNLGMHAEQAFRLRGSPLTALLAPSMVARQILQSPLDSPFYQSAISEEEQTALKHAASIVLAQNSAVANSPAYVLVLTLASVLAAALEVVTYIHKLIESDSVLLAPNSAHVAADRAAHARTLKSGLLDGTRVLHARLVALIASLAGVAQVPVLSTASKDLLSEHSEGQAKGDTVAPPAPPCLRPLWTAGPQAIWPVDVALAASISSRIAAKELTHSEHQTSTSSDDSILTQLKHVANALDTLSARATAAASFERASMLSSSTQVSAANQRITSSLAGLASLSESLRSALRHSSDMIIEESFRRYKRAIVALDGVPKLDANISHQNDSDDSTNSRKGRSNDGNIEQDSSVAIPNPFALTRTALHALGYLPEEQLGEGALEDRHQVETITSSLQVDEHAATMSGLSRSHVTDAISSRVTSIIEAAARSELEAALQERSDLIADRNAERGGADGLSYEDSTQDASSGRTLTGGDALGALSSLTRTPGRQVQLGDFARYQHKAFAYNAYLQLVAGEIATELGSVDFLEGRRAKHLLARSRAETAKALQRAEAAERNLATAQSAAESLADRVEMLEKNSTELRDALRMAHDTLQSERAHFHKEIKRLTKAAETNQQRAEKAEQEAASLSTANEQLRQRVAHLEQEAHRLRTDVFALEADVLSLAKARDSLAQAYSTQAQEIRTLRASSAPDANTQAELRRLRRLCSQLQRKLDQQTSRDDCALNSLQNGASLADQLMKDLSGDESETLRDSDLTMESVPVATGIRNDISDQEHDDDGYESDGYHIRLPQRPLSRASSHGDVPIDAAELANKLKDFGFLSDSGPAAAASANNLSAAQDSSKALSSHNGGELPTTAPPMLSQRSLTLLGNSQGEPAQDQAVRGQLSASGSAVHKTQQLKSVGRTASKYRVKLSVGSVASSAAESSSRAVSIDSETTDQYTHSLLERAYRMSLTDIEVRQKQQLASGWLAQIGNANRTIHSLSMGLRSLLCNTVQAYMNADIARLAHHESLATEQKLRGEMEEVRQKYEKVIAELSQKLVEYTEELANRNAHHL